MAAGWLAHRLEACLRHRHCPLSDHRPSRAFAAAARTQRGSWGCRVVNVFRSLLTVSAAWCASLSFATLAWASGLVIQNPQPGQNLRDNRGQMTVQLALEDKAELPRSFAFRILLNGQPAAPDTPHKHIALTGVNRGTHEMQALIVNSDGQVVTRSPIVSFTLHQASRLNPP